MVGRFNNMEDTHTQHWFQVRLMQRSTEFILVQGIICWIILLSEAETGQSTFYQSGSESGRYYYEAQRCELHKKKTTPN